jgi:hypothetical protein
MDRGKAIPQFETIFGEAQIGDIVVTLHSPLQIPLHLVASDDFMLVREDGGRMGDQPQSFSVWPESSEAATADAYGEAPVFWLPPLRSSASEESFGDRAMSERIAPATLRDAALALMNV